MTAATHCRSFALARTIHHRSWHVWQAYSYTVSHITMKGWLHHCLYVIVFPVFSIITFHSVSFFSCILTSFEFFVTGNISVSEGYGTFFASDAVQYNFSGYFGIDAPWQIFFAACSSRLANFPPVFDLFGEVFCMDGPSVAVNGWSPVAWTVRRFGCSGHLNDRAGPWGCRKFTSASQTSW